MQNAIFAFLMLIVITPLLALSEDDAFKSIKNYHFVSKQLASSGMLELKDYDLIKAYGLVMFCNQKFNHRRRGHREPQKNH